VLASKKRFTTVFPRRAGTFLMSRVSTSSIDRAVSMTNSISSGWKSDSPRTCRRCHSMTYSPFPCGSSFKRTDHSSGGPLDPHQHGLRPGRRDVPAHEVGADGKFPVTAVDEDRQLDVPRAAEVDQSVHRRPYRSARIEDVVDQDHPLVVDGERDLGPLHARLVSARARSSR